MDMIPVVSIALEFVIAVLALVTGFRGRVYMLGFAITFGIYVYYDLARLYTWEASEAVLSVAFLVATVSALAAIVGMLKSTNPRNI